MLPSVVSNIIKYRFLTSLWYKCLSQADRNYCIQMSNSHTLIYIITLLSSVDSNILIKYLTCSFMLSSADSNDETSML